MGKKACFAAETRPHLAAFTGEGIILDAFTAETRRPQTGAELCRAGK